MPYFIAFLNTVDPEKDAAILTEHKAYLDRYIKEGKIFAKGPFLDHSGGLIIYHTATEEEAYQIAINDPVVKEKSRQMVFKAWKSTLPE